MIPPHSIGMIASALRPRWLSSRRSARTASSPLGIFSTITVGAPIIAVEITKASGSSSSTLRTVSGPFSATAASTIRRPM